MATNEAEVLSLQGQVSDAEWAARVDLAACYRMVAYHGWDDTIFTHISVRVPNEDEHFLINPFGMYFDEITASSLVKVDLKGNIVMPSPYFINPAGFVIHGAIHAARDDAHCVLHTHTVAGMAVAAQKQGLLPLSQTAMSIYSDLAYHDYEGIVLDEDERERLIPNVGDKNNVILRNHGLLTMGTDVGEAYLRMFFLQKACETQVAALAQSGAQSDAQGGELIMPSEDVAHRVSAQTVGGFTGLNALNWAAVMRKADRVSPGFRE